MHVSFFADDVAILAHDNKLHMTEMRLQQGVQAVTTWSMDWKMSFSAQKLECSFFSTNSYESKWQPSLTQDGQPVRYNATPKFLGVTYHRQLTFSRHAALIGNSLKRQKGALQKRVGDMIVKPPRILHRNRALEGGMRRIFVAAVDIELNAGESGEIATLRRTGHH